MQIDILNSRHASIRPAQHREPLSYCDHLSYKWIYSKFRVKLKQIKQIRIVTPSLVGHSFGAIACAI
jgi:hypothetical protein